MPPLELTLAVLSLLLVPGPTNALVLVAGAERGLASAARLIPAELAGYLLTVLPLTVAGAAVLASHPRLHATVTLAAALWVAVLAVRLWRVPQGDARPRSVNARALFVTTALNPKALIFGLVLLPSPDRLALNLAIFACLVVLVAVFWAGLGAALGRGGLRQSRALVLLRRLASGCLAAMSVLLVLRGVST